MRTLLLLLSPVIALAQITVYTVSGSVETPLGATVDLGKSAVGDFKDVRFRVRNNNKSATQVTTMTLAGAGFTFADRPSLPYTVAPGNFVDATVRFNGTIAATYSATMNINTASTLLIASAAVSPKISAASGCTLDTATSALFLAAIEALQKETCTLTFDAPFQSAKVTGVGFSSTPTGPTSLSVIFQPTAAGLYSGTLTVDLRSYSLNAAATQPVLPKPIIQFDAPVLTSNLQTRLTIRIPTAAKVDASGSVTVVFSPDPLTAKEDLSLMFLATGGRKLPVAIKAGSSQFTINGQSSVVFQTGTTAGRFVVQMTLDVPTAEDPTTQFVLAPRSINLDTASAARNAGSLDLRLVGFDNTYSTGKMTFTFYKPDGSVMQPITADFTPDFRSFFDSGTSGSAFQVRISFPTVGDSTLIGAIEAQLTNSAGSISTGKIAF